jgi:hypothetical protein
MTRRMRSIGWCEQWSGPRARSSELIMARARDIHNRSPHRPEGMWTASGTVAATLAENARRVVAGMSVIRALGRRVSIIGALGAILAIVGSRRIRATPRRAARKWPSRSEFAGMDAAAVNLFLESVGSDVRVEDAPQRAPETAETVGGVRG